MSFIVVNVLALGLGALIGGLIIIGHNVSIVFIQVQLNVET